MTPQRALPLALLLTLTGCALDGTDEDLAQSRDAASLTATDAQLVLDLCNYPGTDMAVLDEAVGLDRRAAEGIVQHRNGLDGVAPSADDDLFDSVGELDAVAYVGEAAFARLLQYASEHPAPAGVHVEGVDFAGWQAEAVLWGVNQASVEELDVAVALDARAAANLVAAAPFESVEAVGAVGYVGSSALTSLRQYAATWWAELQGSTGGSSLAGTYDGVFFDEETARVAFEIANLATHEQLVTHGMWSQGATAIVASRPYAGLAEVAAVGGVGTATMQALHDFATSGAWSHDCSVNLGARVDANAADLTALLEEATKGDWPYAEVIALEVPSCVSMDQSNQRDAIIDDIIEQGVIDWSYDENAQYLAGDDFVRGAALFVNRMDLIKEAIEDAVVGGYVPETSADADRLARLDAIHAALTSGPRAEPSSYWLATLWTDVEACSEEAVILLDPATNHLWIVHRFARC